MQEVKLRDNSLVCSTTLLVRKAMDTNKHERPSNLSKGTPPLLLLYKFTATVGSSIMRITHSLRQVWKGPLPAAEQYYHFLWTKNSLQQYMTFKIYVDMYNIKKGKCSMLQLLYGQFNVNVIMF